MAHEITRALFHKYLHDDNYTHSFLNWLDDNPSLDTSAPSVSGEINVEEIVMRHMYSKGCNSMNGYKDLCEAIEEVQKEVNVLEKEMQDVINHQSKSILSSPPKLQIPTEEEIERFSPYDGDITRGGQNFHKVWKNGAKWMREKILLSIPLTGTVDKEKIKELLTKSAFYVEPKDKNIVYINIERTAEEISSLIPCSKTSEMNEEIASEAIGLFSKQYDDEEAGIHFKQRMKFLSSKYNYFSSHQ